MDSEKILEQMKAVYQQSVRFQNNGQKMKINSEESQSLNNNDSHFIEIDGNYLLFFNDIYTSNLGKFLKNILKKLAWPILKRQTYFNSAIRQLLHKLVQKNYEDLVKSREVNEKITQLELKFEELSTKIQTDNIHINNFTSAESAKIKSGLWFNEPIIIDYSGEGEAYWAVTNERILEKTFVIHSLARFCDSKNIEILDVGAAESLLSYELASFDYSVTAIDIRPIALSHPNLKFVKSDICQPVFSSDSFDCVIALSTLEHIGLGWYGDEKGNSYDMEAVKQINLLLKPAGIFILTVPYGRKAVTPVHRIYDQESLQKLTQDFTVMQISYGVRKDNFTWTITENELEASVKEHNPDNYLPGAVAMLVCKKNIL
ncbi:class I SAM-dependent methyltransferase [Dolichospermum compactum]|uniref:TPR domain protein n=1 Tax=Dolichospermum compactum NIES-806 TaxID=1973481 RepID=A0A1Z4V4L7_9CYAN|nr:class I SAM-dependent methyltransferase [Dolichospermum compactum]MDM3855707.1 class I SAM-dependent methyltransferase [Aphanizomenon gracile PMC649.10]BAZ86319.1 TPR domain protein [Dolichospermum compactum NIES-806]